jgi:hypothetical protein
MSYRLSDRRVPLRVILGFAGVCPLICWSQTEAPSQTAATSVAPGRLPRIGIGLRMSTLGAGIEAATAVTRRSNLRVGFNAFDYSTSLYRDGIYYNGTLSLRSVAVFYDQYLKGGFHVSPGLLVYNGNLGTADATAPGGQSFSLGSQTYFSSKADPLTGTGTLDFDRKVAPALMFGFGNLLPRSQRHFSLTFDFGVIFQGPSSVMLKLAGSACNSSGNQCQDIRSSPAIQAGIQAQQVKLSDSVTPYLQYYPVVSLGFGYKF